ncbi:NAD-dependent epimerase/dehydratase family protein [Paenibacillus camelliae]|uniref:NAD-dependent epimerase/dehydratase family protein n=1 Tax=Paenibacillus camelliae TaxID=512410 RepID=UPI0020401B99|nr:NAD(P)-dependent oxidoreductase [Paenibacillus camelliae]MCM3633964.1 NAD(P)-dependent oxidoreductase [Paenibacillus camelliae]
MIQIKVAISGGNGSLGKELVKKFLENKKFTPIILSRIESDTIEYETRKTDYSLDNLIKSISDVEAFVHLASVRGNSKSVIDYIENLRITENIYKACYENNIFNVIYSSSIAVYSNEKQLPWDEENEKSPISAYGVSKLCCEHIGDFYNKQYNMSIKNLRFPPIYGVVSDTDQLKGRMINIFIQQAYKKEKLILNTDTNNYRDFLYIKDAVNAIVTALNHDEKKGAFNIGSNELFTNKQIAELINEVFNNSNNLFISKKRADTKSYSAYFNCEKAESELGYTPQYSMKKAMYEIYGEMKNVCKIY